jgi:hypothetical protein
MIVVILVAAVLFIIAVGLSIARPENTFGIRCILLSTALLLVITSPSFASTYYHLPNALLTPGKVASTNVEEVCNPAYPTAARNVSQYRKNKVYKRYGVTKANCTNGCKIDHLIPIAIGGANDIENLWPHEYGADWTVNEKTRLEVRLRKAVCKEKMPIIWAQQCIASDWTVCYSGFFPGEHEKRVQK